MFKTTAIVGPSGSGKSKFVQLLERFYNPFEGDILLDGNNLKKIDIKCFKMSIGSVGQEPVLFNTTIKDNIKYGKENATDEEVQEVLKQVNAWDFVNKLEGGINANVGQAGGQLSGGQKQRLAIARAMLRNSKVLLLDEATSALDKNSEEVVQKVLDNIMTYKPLLQSP